MILSITGPNNNAESRRSGVLAALLHRWQEALAEIRASRLSAGLRRRAEVREDGSGAPDRTAGEPQSLPLPDERSQALAVLCDRLLQELDAAEVRGAEIRFAVHKHEHPDRPRIDADSVADAAVGELVWELRHLIAWSGGAIADVARALETRGVDLDDNARELLKEEIADLDGELATLKAHLEDPLDWDTEFECLLAGEVAPFDDEDEEISN